MINRLREAYENYEIMRQEQEAVKATVGDSSDNIANDISLENRDASSKSHGQWSPKKELQNFMGVSKEIREIFHGRRKENKDSDKEYEKMARMTQRAQVPILFTFSTIIIKSFIGV